MYLKQAPPPEDKKGKIKLPSVIYLRRSGCRDMKNELIDTHIYNRIIYTYIYLGLLDEKKSCACLLPSNIICVELAREAYA